MADVIDIDLQGRLNRMNPVAAEAGLGDMLVGILSNIASLEASSGGPINGQITLQNSSGSITRTLTVVDGVATLAATDTLLANAGAVTVKNSTGTVTNSATATVAAGVLTQAALPATVALVSSGGQVQVETSANTDPHTGTYQVSLGALTVVNLAATVAMVDNGDALVLQNSSGVVSAGNAGLNSPAAAIVSAGVVTAVKAAA